MRSWRFFIAFGTLLVLVSCAGFTTPPGQGVAIRIEPTEVALAAGGDVQFRATVTRSKNTAVRWTATNGTISGAGSLVTFTAPSQAGDYLVTVISEADATKTASAVVHVSVPGGSGEGVLLAGDPASPALEAVADFWVRPGVTPAVISVDGAGRVLARTVLTVSFADGVSVGDVNAVLVGVGARIIDMVSGRLVLVVRVPDPGSLVGLDALLADLERDPRVEFALAGALGAVSMVPPRFVDAATNAPDDLYGIAHHVAVNAHALWNSAAALSASSRPLLIVADAFGEGPLDSAFSVEHVAGEIAVGPPYHEHDKVGHGYHVLSVIAAAFDAVAGASEVRDRPAGIYPLPSRLAVVDWQGFGEPGAAGAQFVPLAVLSNAIIRRVRDAVAAGDRNVVVNTSIGQRGTREADALAWIELVRGREGRFTVGAGLESAFVHVAAAGNAWVGGDYPKAERMSPYNAASLMDDLRVWVGFERRRVPNLTNVLVVENVRHGTSFWSGRIEADCLNAFSAVGGHVAAVGSDVYAVDVAERGMVLAQGTSFSAPQVAGLAQWLWTVAPSLSVVDVTALVTEGARAGRSCGGEPAPAPIIDAYRSALALDARVPGAPTRRALLDVNGDGRFDEVDLQTFAQQWVTRGGTLDYSRFDLNASGRSGGDVRQPFDLTMDGAFGSVEFTVEAHIDRLDQVVTIGVHESALTDLDILCYYAYDAAIGWYEGDREARRELIGTACATGVLDDFGTPIAGIGDDLGSGFDDPALDALYDVLKAGLDTSDGTLRLSERTSTFPFIWIALSARGTIAKIDTGTGEVLGEYRTSPDGVGANPSRTTVGLDGSVWAGNRSSGYVVHVGLREAGQCVDRNGDGSITTSTGYGDVLPWPAGGDPVDECILHLVDHVGTDARHVSVNADGNIWVGSAFGTNSRMFQLIEAASGAIIRTEGPFGCGGYGGLVDRQGVVWSASSGSELLRWNPAEPAVVGVNPRCLSVTNYGLAVDNDGWIWVSSLSGNAVRKVSPDGYTVLGPFSHGAANAQGLAVDERGHVWVSSSLYCTSNCPVGHLRNDGTFVGSVTGGAGSTGVAVDAEGKVWTANINASTATRIDPAAGPIGVDGFTPVGAVDLTVALPGSNPYNYSDMTGRIARTITTIQGTWNATIDSEEASYAWQRVVWRLRQELPAGTGVEVKVRAADQRAELGSRAYVEVESGVDLGGVVGRYLQVEVKLFTEVEGSSPEIESIRLF